LAGGVIAFQLLLAAHRPALIMRLQQVHTAAGGSPARTPLCLARHRFPTASIEYDGRQRCITPTPSSPVGLSQNCPFRYTSSQLAEPELESCLRMKSNYKKRHVVKLLGVSIFGYLWGLRRRLAASGWFIAHSVSSITRVCRSERCAGDAVVCVFGRTISFWFSPCSHLSRVRVRADASRGDHGDATAIQALRKLTEKTEQPDAHRSTAVYTQPPCSTGSALQTKT